MSMPSPRVGGNRIRCSFRRVHSYVILRPERTYPLAHRGHGKLWLPCLLVLLGALLLIAPPASAKTPAHIVEIKGIINPVMAGYVTRAIADAEADEAALVILTLDTPGGLESSMREITQSILSSRVPVVVFVYPAGARAGSAGVFITYAAHVAAMAPTTNIGSAHPVAIGEGGSSADSSAAVLAEKVTNDAVASIRSMAELRGRDADWAERAVRESANLPASEAARLGVVDLIADDVPDLLRKIEGRAVRLPQGEIRIAVGDGAPTPRPMNPLERLLLVLTDPTIAYLLLSLGGLALVYELASPGAILPGVVGGIALLLALYALGTLPVNIAGVGLILFALLLFFADLALGGSGVLTVGGIVSFALGSLLLVVWPETQAYARVLLPAGVAMTVVIAASFGAITVVLVRARLQRSSIAEETLVGASGLTRTEVGAQGTVFVAGELWGASAADPDQPIPAGQRVRVVSVEGLRLTIQSEEAGV